MKLKPYLVVALFCSYSFVILFLVAPVMRESDQASLVDGAIQLVRGGDVFGRDFYNYSRQFGSYWILALVYGALGLADVSADLDAIIYWGNLTAASIFVGGLLALMSMRAPCRCWQFVVYAAVLLSPCLLYTSPSPRDRG